MKHLSLLKNLAMACGTLAAAVAFSSCSSTLSPSAAAGKIADSSALTVFSHNTVNDPHNRICREAGPMPERTMRALQAWLNNSTVKTFSYVNPQYFVTVKDTKGRERVWGLCSDGQGNLVGVLIPRAGVKAWDLPPTGNYRVYVCDTDRRKAYSDAIMNSLAEAGYDTYRIETLKSMGLTQQRYLISKPLSDTQQKRLEEIRAQELAKQKAAAAADEADTEETTSSDDDFEDDFDDSGDEESSDDSSSDEDEDFDDSGFDELGF